MNFSLVRSGANRGSFLELHIAAMSAIVVKQTFYTSAQANVSAQPHVILRTISCISLQHPFEPHCIQPGIFAEVLPVPRPHVQPGAAGEEADQGAAAAAATPATVWHAAGL